MQRACSFDIDGDVKRAPPMVLDGGWGQLARGAWTPTDVHQFGSRRGCLWLASNIEGRYMHEVWQLGSSGFLRD